MTRIAAIVVMLLAAGAFGQIRTGVNDPNKPRLGMGEIVEDPNVELNAMRKRCLDELEAARKHIAAGKWGDARECLDRVNNLAPDRALIEQMLPLLQQLEDEGKKRLKAASELYAQKQYAQAFKDYGSIVRQFAGLPSGDRARQLLNQSQTDPEAQSALQEAKAAMLVGMLDDLIAQDAKFGPSSQPAVAASGGKPVQTQPAAGTEPAVVASARADAIRRISTERQVKAVELLETLAKQYALAPSGKQAGEDLKVLMADEPFRKNMQQYKDRQAPARALQLAEAYRKAGMKDKARDMYKDVIEKYPQSDEAGKAKLALTDLPGK